MNNNIKHLPNGDFQTLPDTGQPGDGGSGCASPQPAVTVIFDDGEGPTDALLHSPCLNIRDYGAVLVGCEFTATVRDAFRKRGFDAWSNDILPTEGDPRWHIQSCVRDAIRSRRWDCIILHLECTKMAVCGNSTYGKGGSREDERAPAVDWAVETVALALEHSELVAVENPASVLFPALRERLGAVVQYIQPWEHGHLEQKKTGFALFGLPPLRETRNVHDEMMRLPRHKRERIHYMSPGKRRGLERSRFFPGIATAMADQWGSHLNALNNGAENDPDSGALVSSSFHAEDNN